MHVFRSFDDMSTTITPNGILAYDGAILGKKKPSPYQRRTQASRSDHALTKA